jgi:hypothetical protein
MGEVSTHAAGLRAAFLVPLLGVSAMLAFYLANGALSDRLRKAGVSDLLLD